MGNFLRLSKEISTDKLRKEFDKLSNNSKFVSLETVIDFTIKISRFLKIEYSVSQMEARYKEFDEIGEGLAFDDFILFFFDQF